METTKSPTAVVICAWCKVLMQAGVGPVISHGICPTCTATFDPRD